MHVVVVGPKEVLQRIHRIDVAVKLSLKPPARREPQAAIHCQPDSTYPGAARERHTMIPSPTPGRLFPSPGGRGSRGGGKMATIL